jgi:hypothetical protein
MAAPQFVVEVGQKHKTTREWQVAKREAAADNKPAAEKSIYQRLLRSSSS